MGKHGMVKSLPVTPTGTVVRVARWRISRRMSGNLIWMLKFWAHCLRRWGISRLLYRFCVHIDPSCHLIQKTHIYKLQFFSSLHLLFHNLFSFFSNILFFSPWISLHQSFYFFILTWHWWSVFSPRQLNFRGGNLRIPRSNSNQSREHTMRCLNKHTEWHINIVISSF